MYLKEVKCDVADVTWQLRGRKAGFFKTRLMLTPHGRDFDYWANGGMKTGMVPDLALRQVHLLVTKELLTRYNRVGAEFGERGPHSGQGTGGNEGRQEPLRGN